MFLELRELGYEGSYDRVAAFGRQWEVDQMASQFCEQINTALSFSVPVAFNLQNDQLEPCLKTTALHH